MNSLALFSLLAAGQIGVTWYLIPLAAVISLVYNTSRYELPEKIIRRSIHWFVQVMLFMGAVLIVLYLLSFNL